MAAGDTAHLKRTDRQLATAERPGEEVPVAKIDIVAVAGGFAAQPPVQADEPDVEVAGLQRQQPTEIPRTGFAVFPCHHRCGRHGDEELANPLHRPGIAARNNLGQRVHAVAGPFDLAFLIPLVADELDHHQRHGRHQHQQHQQLAQTQPGTSPVDVGRLQRIGRLELGLVQAVLRHRRNRAVRLGGLGPEQAMRAPTIQCKACAAAVVSAELSASSTSDSRFQQCQYSWIGNV